MGHAPTPAESPTILTRGSARRRHHAVSWSVPYGRAGGWRAADNVLAETAVLPAMKSVSRRRPACLPIVHIYCAVVVAIVVESTKGFEYYCSTPR